MMQTATAITGMEKQQTYIICLFSNNKRRISLRAEHVSNKGR